MRVARDLGLKTRMDRGFRNVLNRIKNKGTPVTDLMGEINAATQEQALGVSQVGEAVSQMDQATQQNAALVEEMAAAASSLKSQANDLVQVVAIFKTSASQQMGGLSSARSASYHPTPAPSASLPTKAAAKAISPAKAPSAPKLSHTPKSSKADSDDWETF